MICYHSARAHTYTHKHMKHNQLQLSYSTCMLVLQLQIKDRESNSPACTNSTTFKIKTGSFILSACQPVCQICQYNSITFLKQQNTLFVSEGIKLYMILTTATHWLWEITHPVNQDMPHRKKSSIVNMEVTLCI